MKQKTKRQNVGNPQLEEGHTRIANELLEALNRTPMGDHERRVMGVVLREVYGWHGRRDAELSLSKIAAGAGLDRRLIPRAINRLIERNMIRRDGSKTAIQKKYKEWKPLEVTSRKMTPTPDIRRDATPDIRRDATLTSPEMTEVTSVEMPPHIKDARATKQELKQTTKARSKATGGKPPGARRAFGTFPDGKPDYRNPFVTTILESLKTLVGVPALDGSEATNRREATFLLQKVRKLAPEAEADKDSWAVQFIVQVLMAVRGNDFWHSRLTSAKLLNGHFLQIAKSSTAPKKGGVYRGNL